MTTEQLAAITKLAPHCVAVERATKLPAELSLAQACLESGWLKSAPGNNCHGIKEYPGCWGRQLLRTTEWFTDAEREAFLKRGDGRTAEFFQPVEQRTSGGFIRRRYRVRDWFATFPDLGACIEKHGRLITAGKPYRAAWHGFLVHGDPEELISDIAPIYATDPGYGPKVLRIAREPEVRAALTKARAS